jgi:predicted transcriptional regulator of viral defense system
MEQLSVQAGITAAIFSWVSINLSKTQMPMKRLLSIVDNRGVVRASQLYRSGAHPDQLSKALHQGLLVKIGRGLYTRKDFPSDFEHQIILACVRIPHGVVCLESALGWHGILPADPGPIWMAINRRAKKPVVDGLKLRFVRFSGAAFAQGVVNAKIDGVPVRIYSAAKAIADCLKYRRTLGGNFAAKVLRESIVGKKCSEQRLRHFAKICRVRKLVHAAYSSPCQVVA